MQNFEAQLEKYAQLAIKVGVNLQPSQLLVVNAPVMAAYFVRTLVKEAYKAGAGNVHVEWHDEEITHTKLSIAPFEALTQYPLWKAKGYEEMAEAGAAVMTISIPNPDLLRDIPGERIAAANKANAVAMEGFKKYTQTGKISWTTICIPGEEWAAKIFPYASAEEGMTLLWENIFNIVRASAEDPVAAWQQHLSNVRDKLSLLNSKRYKKLFFKSAGTDLSMALPDKHLWVGGGIHNEKGTYFVPNLPTEEVFTMPLKHSLEGVVTSTKPLNYGGNVIENFTLTFKEGRIVEFTAEKGYDTLKRLIETDEGAHYIGEVALVPHDSPISNTNLVFFNTLFDENASCHLAIGAAYPLSIEGGSAMGKEELEQQGANTSLVHVDFMIGSQNMEISAETAEGNIEIIFSKGNWA